MLKSPQEGQCNMKIEDESLCDSFNCQKAAEGRDLSREWLVHEAHDLKPGDLCSPLPKGLGSVAVSTAGIANRRLQRRARTEIREVEQIRSVLETKVLSLSS